MKSKINSVSVNFLAFSAFINTLIITPFFNKDGMIIPKLILMCVVSMYFLPIVVLNCKYFFNSRIEKVLFFLQCAGLLHSLVVLFISSAPLEQQIFGRTGRGLGLITIFSLSIILMAAMLLVNNSGNQILFSLVIATLISTLYSVFQSYGIDLLKWETKTNGVIGTLGNPNFQSAFAAMVLVPSFVYFWSIKKQHILAIALFIFLIFSIYRTQSRQGFVAGFFSVMIAVMIYFWYKSKFIFITLTIGGITSAFIAISGMLNSGPLAGYLYNASVQSRGDFWRSAFNTANAHPIFGVGLDSFGDYSLRYRDQVAANHSFAEYTDNAHNFFLEQAATGGYPFALINLLVLCTVIFAFFKIQSSTKKFDPVLVSLFSAWVAFQMTSVISPGNLVTMYWNALISGSIIGLVKFTAPNQNISVDTKSTKVKSNFWIGSILAISGFILLLPFFNTDRLQLQGMQRRDANLVIKAATSYPESTVRYSLIGQELLNSGLTQPALELSRSAVEFNPKSAGLWALILVNPNATLEERLNAKKVILELDPLNKNVMDFNP
jgi:O-antigen ligase